MLQPRKHHSYRIFHQMAHLELGYTSSTTSIGTEGCCHQAGLCPSYPKVATKASEGDSSCVVVSTIRRYSWARWLKPLRNLSNTWKLSFRGRKGYCHENRQAIRKRGFYCRDKDNESIGDSANKLFGENPSPTKVEEKSVKLRETDGSYLQRYGSELREKCDHIRKETRRIVQKTQDFMKIGSLPRKTSMVNRYISRQTPTKATAPF